MKKLIGWLTPRRVLGIGLLAAILSIIGAFEPWAAAVGGVLSLGALVLQYRLAGPKVVDFSAADWQPRLQEGDYQLPIRNHGKGRHPSVTVHKRGESGIWAEIECDVQTADDGIVILGAAIPFEGQARVT